MTRMLVLILSAFSWADPGIAGSSRERRFDSEPDFNKPLPICPIRKVSIIYPINLFRGVASMSLIRKSRIEKYSAREAAGICLKTFWHNVGLKRHKKI